MQMYKEFDHLSTSHTMENGFEFTPNASSLERVVKNSGCWVDKMAFHKHVKLTPLRLTRRCGSDVQVKCVHRGVSVCSEADSSGSQQPEDNCEYKLQESEECSPLPNEPSDHQLHGEASVRNWEKLRKSMLLDAVESYAMPAASVAPSWQFFVVRNVDQWFTTAMNVFLSSMKE